MLVPDPGLFYKLDALLLSEKLKSSRTYQDCKIYCQDGDFFFNSLYLIAASKMIQESRCSVIHETDFVLIVDHYRRIFIEQVLDKLFIKRENSFTEEEIRFLYNLGIVTTNEVYEPEETPTCEMDLSEDPEFFIREESCQIVESRHEINSAAPPENDPKLPLQEVENESSGSNGNNASSIRNPQVKFKCLCCNLMLNKQEKLIHKKENPSHTISILEHGDNHCKLCNKSFKKDDFKSFRSHIANHKNGSGVFSCPSCDKVSNTWGHFMQHMYKHEPGWEKPFRCRYCEYSSINRSNIEKHESTRHLNPETRNFSCQLCDKKFKVKTHLSQHMRSHGSYVGSCEVCSKQFKSPNGLSQHRRLHTEEKLSPATNKRKNIKLFKDPSEPTETKEMQVNEKSNSKPSLLKTTLVKPETSSSKQTEQHGGPDKSGGCGVERSDKNVSKWPSSDQVAKDDNERSLASLLEKRLQESNKEVEEEEIVVHQDMDIKIIIDSTLTRRIVSSASASQLS